MSLIQKIQEKGAWIVFILIALALIAFVLMDSSFRSGSMFSNTTVVGKINGEKIQKDAFESKLDLITQMQGQQAPPREQLVGQVWNYMVQSTVLQQEIDKLGLSFDSKELDAILFGANPPQFMKQQFSDPQTGMYDVNAARQAFAQLKKQNGPQLDQITEMFINPLKEQALAQKYQTLITGAAYIPSWLSKKEAADNNSIASFSYVSVPYTSIPDNQVKVSDAEIEAYVAKHPKQFEIKEERRGIDYIAFNAAPSIADSNAIRNELDQLKQPFALATNEKDFVSVKGSSVPYYDGYISGKDLQIPNKENVIGQPVGAVYGPYIDGTTFAISKLVSTASVADTANIRHILVSTRAQNENMPSRDDSSALRRLDSAIALLNHGARFDSVAAVYSDDPGSKSTGGVIENLTAGKTVPAFNDFILTGHAGEKKTVKTEYGYHYIEILSQKGRETGYKIATITKSIVPSSATITDASNKANQFAAASQNAADFKSNADKSHLNIQQIPALGKNDLQVGQLGDSRELVRWIFSNKIGSISSPTQVGNYYVIAKVSSVQKEGLANAATARATVEPILRNEKKAQMIIASKFKGNTLQAYAQSAGVQIAKADSVSFASPFIPGLGAEPKVVGAAFNKAYVNKVSIPLAGNSGVFAVQPLSISAVPGAAPEQIRMSLRQQWIQQISYGSIQALINAAKIKDNRSDFY